MKSIIESLLLSSGEDGLTLVELADILEENDHEHIKLLLEQITEELIEHNRGIRLSKFGNKYLFTTLPEHHEYLSKMANNFAQAPLSKAAIEALSIIAYCQPITCREVEELRGVRSERVLQNLRRKTLITRVDSSNEYITTDAFLDYFGLETIDDLPILLPEERLQEVSV